MVPFILRMRAVMLFILIGGLLLSQVVALGIVAITYFPHTIIDSVALGSSLTIFFVLFFTLSAFAGFPITLFWGIPLGLWVRARLLRATRREADATTPLATPLAISPLPSGQSIETDIVISSHVPNRWTLFSILPLVVLLYAVPLTVLFAQQPSHNFVPVLILLHLIYWYAFAFWYRGATARQHLLVDDSGVTLTINKRIRHLKWHDIIGFLEIGSGSEDKEGASYWLIGRQQTIRFDYTKRYRLARSWFNPYERIWLALSPLRAVHQSNYKVSSGIQVGDQTAFERRAQQILATIQARSGIALRTASDGNSYARYLAHLQNPNEAPQNDASDVWESPIVATIANADWPYLRLERAYHPTATDHHWQYDHAIELYRLSGDNHDALICCASFFLDNMGDWHQYYTHTRWRGILRSPQEATTAHTHYHC